MKIVWMNECIMYEWTNVNKNYLLLRKSILNLLNYYPKSRYNLQKFNISMYDIEATSEKFKIQITISNLS